MSDDFLISVAFPDDTYRNVFEEFKLLLEQEPDEQSKFTRDVIEFNIYVRFQTFHLLNKEEGAPNITEYMFGHNVDLIPPQYFAEFFFNEGTIEAVLDFLNKYDKNYFWSAFGISLDKGDVFYNRMVSFEENLDVLSEIRNEIINSNKLKRDILVNELHYHIHYWKQSEESIENLAHCSYCANKLTRKYQSILEALDMGDEIDDNEIHIFSGVQAMREFQDDKLKPQSFLKLIDLLSTMGSIVFGARFIRRCLTNENSQIRNLVLYSFQKHRHGLEGYINYYSGCIVDKIAPPFYIDENSYIYFYNSYKAPQIGLPYCLYFSELSEEEARKKTKKCFEIIFEGLKHEGFLDKNCRIEEFLWAFGLIDEYPFAFKKIKFYTLSGRNNKDKGNGAFLCLLNILGLETEAIKMLLHRNPKKSLINATFDLTIKSNTVMSKDYNALLKIVKSSGLPIIKAKTIKN